MLRRVSAVIAGAGGLRHRGTLDSTPEVTRFAQTLERVCIGTVESGKMTKDLALLVGPETPFLTTESFLDELDRGLQDAMYEIVTASPVESR